MWVQESKRGKKKKKVRRKLNRRNTTLTWKMKEGFCEPGMWADSRSQKSKEIFPPEGFHNGAKP